MAYFSFPHKAQLEAQRRVVISLSRVGRSGVAQQRRLAGQATQPSMFSLSCFDFQAGPTHQRRLSSSRVQARLGRHNPHRRRTPGLGVRATYGPL